MKGCLSSFKIIAPYLSFFPPNVLKKIRIFFFKFLLNESQVLQGDFHERLLFSEIVENEKILVRQISGGKCPLGKIKRRIGVLV